MYFFNMLVTFIGLIGFIGFSIGTPLPDPQLGNILGSLTGAGLQITQQLASGALGSAASIIGFQPLIDYCNKPEVLADQDLYAAVTYTYAPNVIVPFWFGDCAPYDNSTGSMKLVYFCKPGLCHTYGDYNCIYNDWGNIGPVPLLLPASFFLPNLLDAIDLLGLAAKCWQNDLGL